MKIEVKKVVEIELKQIRVKALVRYWDDANVNGVKDEKGDLIPCREGDNWCPVINIDTGIIENWQQGKTAGIHYKVCDCCNIEVIDIDGDVHCDFECYVQSILCPKEDGYGDYIIMDIDETGKIDGWDKNLVRPMLEDDDE